jgi:Sec-independent protein translocase protein TatA
MDRGRIGFPELMIVLVIIMILFGAWKIPSLGSAVWKHHPQLQAI